MRKIFIGIIIVLMLLLPSIPAMSELNLNDENHIESQNIVNSGKPDLIITNVWFDPINIPPGPWYNIKITIKNIGDEKVDENEDINISIIVKKWFFITYKTYDITIKGGLEPGKRNHSTFVVWDYDYIPGFYRFKCNVNVDKTIDESDYQNNIYSEYALKIFSFWIDF